MNNVLKDVIGKFVLVYLDDIVVFSKNQEEHYKHLQIVLQLLREHELYANVAKCKFLQPELHFLGHVVSATGLHVDPKKIALVKDWPAPTNVQELQKFLGFANYFHKFVWGWALLVVDMQGLLNKKSPFIWTDACEKGFTGLKDALCSAPVLRLPDLNKPFEVIADACGVGLGAVLMQDGQPVAFDGKRLTPAEQNYDVGEQELLAVIHALERWRCYLDGVTFTVVTDHSPNTFFTTKKLLSPRQARWAQRLSPYSFNWQYRPGRKNVADPSSRHPTFTANLILAAITAHMAPDMRPAVVAAAHFLTHACASAHATDADTEAENADAADAEKDRLSQILQGYETDPWFAKLANRLMLQVQGGVYYRHGALVIPDVPELKKEILHELHDANYAGHIGAERTLHNVNRMYWWPRMADEVAEYVKGCLVCQADKTLQKHKAGKLMPLPVPKEAWHHITADRIVGLPKTKRGNTAILVVVDRLTKMTRIGACKDTSTAEDLARLFVDMVWKLHGMPRYITTDRGPEFTNKFVAHILAMLGTEHCKSTAYHPQSDGQTERMNRVLEDMLRHYVNPKQNDWDDLLAPAEFAINNAYQSSIQDTPFFLNYGRHPRMPKDFNADKPSKNPSADNFIINIQKGINKAKLCMEKAQQRQKRYADQDRSDAPKFEVGQLAWLSSKNIAMKAVGTRKLLPRWLGPFEVTAVNGPVTYSLDIPAHYKIHTNFHVSMLRRAYDNGAGVVRPLPTVIEGQEDLEYTVETILDHSPKDRTAGGKGVKYLVKWEGYGPMSNSWEPENNLRPNANGALSDYWKELRAAVQTAQPQVGTDTGLAPSSRNTFTAPGRGVGRATRDRYPSRRRSLRPVGQSLKT